MKKGFLPLLLVVFLLSLSLGSALAQETITIKVSPHVVVMFSTSQWLTVHAEIPYQTVASGSVALNGLPAAWTKADDCGDLVAKFNMDEVSRILSSGKQTLTLTGGIVVDESKGTPSSTFVGSETVQVITCENSKLGASFSAGTRAVGWPLLSRICAP